MQDTTMCLGLRDAARRLGVARRTLYALHYRGELPLVRIAGRTLVRLADLDALVQRGVRERRAEAAGR